VSNHQDLPCRGAAERALEVLRTARKRPFQLFLLSGLPLTLAAAACAAMLLGLFGALLGADSDSVGYAAGLGLLATMFAGVIHNVVRSRPALVQAYRSDAPTLWERQREAILIGVAINLATSVLFFVLGLLVGQSG
jgi:hypothetical protein